ncbi:MAG TPA: hypothetical protein VNJ02_03335 [Vicinamibacterales bacterium]|nr:hypothetical protein [Vicinamibacterales bacterium]
MELNKLLFGGLAVGCLAAAAGGGFLAANRTAPVAEVAVSEPAPAAAVAESEAVITPEPAAPASAFSVQPTDSAPAPTAAAPAAPRRGVAPRVPARPAPLPERRVEPLAPASRSARNEPAARNSADAASANAPAPASASSGGTMWETRPAVEPNAAGSSNARRDVEPEVAPEPAAAELVELVIPAESVLGLQIERTISSDQARVEDRVEARVTRDVRVGSRVAIPAGSMVQGSVLEVERGGKVKERARLGIRFHTVVLADGSRLNIKTDAVVREGPSVATESAAKIGGAAVGGAILGAILGGGKGAIIGGAAGAAGGTAATMAGNRNPAVLAGGSTVSVRVQQPVSVTVER